MNRQLVTKMRLKTFIANLHRVRISCSKFVTSKHNAKKLGLHKLEQVLNDAATIHHVMLLQKIFSDLKYEILLLFISHHSSHDCLTELNTVVLQGNVSTSVRCNGKICMHLSAFITCYVKIFDAA